MQSKWHKDKEMYKKFIEFLNKVVAVLLQKEKQNMIFVFILIEH